MLFHMEHTSEFDYIFGPLIKELPMSHPDTTRTVGLDPTLPDDKDFQGMADIDQHESTAYCPECNETVPVHTNYVTVGEDDVMWETYCINGHLVDED